MSDVRFFPFSNATQYMDWRARNCDRCTKDYDADTETCHCEIEYAVSLASIGNGSIGGLSAVRMGFLDSATHQPTSAYTWDCPERDAEDGSDRRKREFEDAVKHGQMGLSL